MDDLIFRGLGLSTLGIAVFIFGFTPGVALRTITLFYPRDNIRRKELIGELYAVPRIERPLWVAEQLEVALLEGLCPRMKFRRIAKFSFWLLIWWLIASLQASIEFLLKSQLGWSRLESDIAVWSFTIIAIIAAYSYFIGRRFHYEMTSAMQRFLLSEMGAPELIPVFPDDAGDQSSASRRAGVRSLSQKLFVPYHEGAQSRAKLIIDDVLGGDTDRSERAEILLQHMEGCFECGPWADCWICNPIKAIIGKVPTGSRGRIV